MILLMYILRVQPAAWNQDIGIFSTSDKPDNKLIKLVLASDNLSIGAAKAVTTPLYKA